MLGIFIVSQTSKAMHPLHVAASSNDITEVNRLLDNGAKVNQQDINGWTPLHYAILKYNRILVRILLEHGADITITNRDGQTPLQFAQTGFYQDMMVLFQAWQQQRTHISQSSLQLIIDSNKTPIYSRHLRLQQLVQTILLNVKPKEFIGTQHALELEFSELSDSEDEQQDQRNLTLQTQQRPI